MYLAQRSCAQHPPEENLPFLFLVADVVSTAPSVATCTNIAVAKRESRPDVGAKAKEPENVKSKWTRFYRGLSSLWLKREKHLQRPTLRSR
jgi:hypothetical protein